MLRFRLDIGSVNYSVKLAPEVLYPVCGRSPLCVFDSVIDKAMLERVRQSLIAPCRVCEEFRTCLYPILQLIVKRIALRILYDSRLNLT